MGFNSTRESEIRFICLKHSVKLVVLLFHFTEYQIRKTLAKVDVRRIQFFVLLQLVGMPFEGYSQCSSGTSVRYFCLPRNFSSTALPMCRHINVNVFSTVVATTVTADWHPLLGCEAKEPVASNFFIILFKEDEVILILYNPLQSRTSFMKRDAKNAAMALVEFL